MLYQKIINQIVEILDERWPEVCMCNQVLMFWPCPYNHKCSDGCPIYLSKKLDAKGINVQVKPGELPFYECPMDHEYCQRKMGCNDCPKTEENK